MEKKYTFCRICEPCCGFVAEVENNKILQYYADKEHPFSKGYSCIKGREMFNIQYHPKRIKYPLKRNDGQFERISWEQAIDEIGSKLLETKEQHGPDSIGAYLGNVGAFSYSASLYSGAFMNFLGTRNRYGAGSQDCDNKFVHSLKFYGAQFTIITPDFDNIDCFIGMGTNPLAAHFTFANFPNPRGRLKEMAERGCKIAWINPRRTEAADTAGEQFFIRPNTDIFLVLAMINYVLENGLEDSEFIKTYSTGIDELRKIARELGSDLDRVEAVTGIAKQDIIRLTRDFVDASGKGGASLYGRTGKDRGPFATVLAWAIDVFNFITGNIDKKGNYSGEGFYNLAKQRPRAETGQADEPRSRIGNFTPVTGRMPAAIMADEILTPGDGQIKAMIVMAGDPLISCPNTGKIEKAFRSLDLLVTIDIFMNDTGAISDYILPTTTFLERQEFSHVMSAFNPMTFVPYSHAIVKPEGEEKDEWEIFYLLSEKMGMPSLGNQPIEVLKMLFPDGDQPKLNEMLQSDRGIFVNEDRKFRYNVLLPDGINLPGKLIPLAPEDYRQEFDKLRTWEPPHDPAYPFYLISGRQVETINSWIHARGETNYCYINPEDAHELGIADNEIIRVSTKIGSIDIPAKLTDELMKSVVWIPHGWGRTVRDVPEMAVDKRGVNVNLITDDDWAKLEPLARMVMLDGLAVSVERIT